MDAPETVDELVELEGFFITTDSGMDLKGAVSWYKSVPLRAGFYSATEEMLDEYRASDRPKFEEIELLGSSGQRRWEMVIEAPVPNAFIRPTEVECSCWVYNAGIQKIGLDLTPVEVDVPEKIARPGVKVRIVLEVDGDGNRTGRVVHDRCHWGPAERALSRQSES